MAEQVGDDESDETFLERAEFACEEKQGLEKEEAVAKPDGGWGWLVCFGAFITNFVVFGIHNTYGVVYSTLIKELGISSAETAWIGSLGMGLNFFFGPISSALCERIGCRLTSLTGATLGVSGLLLTSFITRDDVAKMYATYGVMWGIGSSFCYVPSMVILGQYFDKRMALANGLGTSGSGFGTLVMAPVIQKLLSTLGWRTTFRFLSGVAALLFIAAWLFKPLPGKDSKDKESPHPCVDLNVWKNKAYIVWVLSIAFFLFGYFIPFIHLVRLAGLLGVSPEKGAWLISYMSISSTVGRVFFGKVGDLKCVNRLLMFQVAILAIGSSTALLSLAKDYAALVAYSLVFGFFDGCFIGQVAVVTSHVIGVKHLGVALGYLFGSIALPMTLGPPVAGWIYDGSKSYNVAFYVAGGTSFLGFLAMFLIPKLVARHAQDWEQRFERRRMVSIESRRRLLSATQSEGDPRARNSFYDVEVFAGAGGESASLTQIAVERPSFNRGRRRSLPAVYAAPAAGAPMSRQGSGARCHSNEIGKTATRHSSLGEQTNSIAGSGCSLGSEKSTRPIFSGRVGRRASLPVISLTPSNRMVPQAHYVLVDANRLAPSPALGSNQHPARSRNRRRGSLPAVTRPGTAPTKATHPRVYELGRRRCSLPLVVLPDKNSPRGSKSIIQSRECSTDCIEERVDEEQSGTNGDSSRDSTAMSKSSLDQNEVTNKDNVCKPQEISV